VTEIRQRKTPRALRAATDDPLEDVRSSFLRMAERFRPDQAADLDASWVVDVAGRGPTTIHVRGEHCLVSPGAIPHPTASLSTDPTTWVDLVDGRVDGIAAFLGGRLSVEGDLNLALRLETLFDPGPGASRALQTRRTRVRGNVLESVVSGTGTPVLLLHGLGASKVSFLPTFDGLADRHEVHALDLPGFGKSDRPLPAGRRYSMAWMADQVHGYIVRNQLRDVHLVGNSMGGRIALELALRHPRSVRSVVGLGSAVAFDEYQRLGHVLRLLQPQWAGVAPFPMRRAWVEGLIRDMFHDPTRVPAANLRAAAEEALASLADRGYRLALLACARRLGCERAAGRNGFWRRLEGLSLPSYWIFGRHDNLVSCDYAERVERALPAARVELWEDVGHVPQFEVPERTNEALLDWLERLDADR
jgi:pimeloyl-ACP methyl ester carboxylesterase